MKITYWMVPCMPVDQKIQNIAFTEKLHNFQMVITMSKTSYQLQTGFNRTLKGSKCIPQTHCMFLIIKSKGAMNVIFWVEFRKCKILYVSDSRAYMGQSSV